MNVYVLVEGPTEKLVYREWVPFSNSDLSYVEHPSMLNNDNFAIVSGGGYPQYLEGIENAVEDVANDPNADRLVVAIDSEDMTRQEKFNEVDTVILSQGAGINYRIIVQHFCLETWGLGNRHVVRRLPRLSRLKEFLAIYDVRTDDPEGLPACPDADWNRAQFAEVYLRAAFLDRYRNFTYSKKNPGALAERHYFDRLKERVDTTGHIDSILEFHTAFI